MNFCVPIAQINDYQLIVNLVSFTHHPPLLFWSVYHFIRKYSNNYLGEGLEKAREEEKDSF